MQREYEYNRCKTNRGWKKDARDNIYVTTKKKQSHSHEKTRPNPILLATQIPTRDPVKRNLKFKTK